MDGAIDPGRSKLGVALGDRDLRFSAILPASRVGDLIGALRTGDFRSLAPFRREGTPPEGGLDGGLYLGNGTGSDVMGELLAEAGLSWVSVEERDSTLLARRVYYRLHPPSGWRRLVPRSLLVPPRDLDDLAAWVLLLRGRGEAFPL